MVLRKKSTLARLKKIIEVDNALEGVFWPIRKRLQILSGLFDLILSLTPYHYKPFTKSFDSLKKYEAWKKKQTNPWFF